VGGEDYNRKFINFIKFINLLISRSKSVYKLCLKQKAADDVFDLPFYLVFLQKKF